MTGFRVAAGGAQAIFGVKPDLTTMGKIIGGGLPVGAYGGRRDIMAHVAPMGSMYQAGTLSGNPLAMAAGIAMLSILKKNPAIYAELESSASRLEKGLAQIISEKEYPLSQNRVGSMFTLFFTKTHVRDFDTAKTSDTVRFGKYFQAMLERGIYLAPSQFEAAFISTAHTESDVDKTLSAARESLAIAFS